MKPEHQTAGRRTSAVDAVACYVCSVCDDQLQRTARNVTGPRSLAEALAGLGSPHDVYECRHAGKPSHNLLFDLRREYDATQSKRLRELLALDIEDARQGVENEAWLPSPTKE